MKYNMCERMLIYFQKNSMKQPEVIRIIKYKNKYYIKPENI